MPRRVKQPDDPAQLPLQMADPRRQRQIDDLARRLKGMKPGAQRTRLDAKLRSLMLLPGPHDEQSD